MSSPNNSSLRALATVAHQAADARNAAAKAANAQKNAEEASTRLAAKANAAYQMLRRSERPEHRSKMGGGRRRTKNVRTRGGRRTKPGKHGGGRRRTTRSKRTRRSKGTRRR